MVFVDAEREPTLTDGEFRMFHRYFRQTCGLHFGDESRFLLEKRLLQRMRTLGVGSFSGYHYLLRRDSGSDEELATVIDELTTNETYFFREQRQLRALMEEILPELLGRREAGDPPVSIWSAGCSSGEEPYSLVMLALEAGFEPRRDLLIYASDISRKMLQRARRGLYRVSSFRETSPLLQKKYFTESDGLWKISDQVKQNVVFAHLNLLDRARISLLGTMDVILCRNVIIYFDLDTKRQVIETLGGRLRPGGYLLLGHSESLINLSDAFRLRQLRNDLVYRKPSRGEEGCDPRHDLVAAAIAAADGPGGIE